MKYVLSLKVIAFNLSFLTFCSQKQSKPGQLLQNSARSDDQKMLNEKQQFELTFKEKFKPQFETAAEQLWKDREARRRKIWVELMLSSHPPLNSQLDEAIDTRFKEQFVNLFQEKYRSIFGKQEVPASFEKCAQINAEERLGLLAKAHAYAYYEGHKNSWKNWFCAWIH